MIIISRLQKRAISEYLVNTVKDYLNKRKAQKDKNTRLEIRGEVPQGSVVGSTFWNIIYDDILKIDVPDGTTLICYVDHMVVVITASTKEELMSKGNVMLSKVKLWMTINKLQTAKEKLKAIILSSNRKTEDIVFELEKHKIVPSESTKYLGMVIDRNLTFGKERRKLERLLGQLLGPWSA